MHRFAAVALLLMSVHEAPLKNARLDPSRIDADKVFLLIDKSDYRLYLFEDVTLLKTYPVVFGVNSLQDKLMQGDKGTPEGSFHILAKKYDNRWSRFLLLDYPTPASREKFNMLKSAGRIPPTAAIGGGIGIHGVRPGEDDFIDNRFNWTEGCISLRNAEIKELYDIVKVGTPVLIRK